MNSIPSVARLACASLLVLSAACGGSAGSVDDPDGNPSAPGTDVPGGPGSTSGGSGSGTQAPPTGGSGANVTLSLRGSTAPVAHADDFASQTPSRQVIAVKSLWLYKSASDPNPLEVLDLGTKVVETDLRSGIASDIGVVALKSLPAGTYTLAKVGVAYVRYSVAARMHSVAAVDGRFDNVQALSDGVVIDGVTRAKGWHRYAFAVGTTTYGTTEGANAPLPQIPSNGGMTLETSGPDAFYVFPMNVTIDPDEPRNQRIVCEVNVHESFRWQDQAQPGYAPKVYDATPSAFEPVMAFGASAFSLSLELAK